MDTIALAFLFRDHFCPIMFVLTPPLFSLVFSLLVLSAFVFALLVYFFGFFSVIIIIALFRWYLSLPSSSL